MMPEDVTDESQYQYGNSYSLILYIYGAPFHLVSLNTNMVILIL